MSADESLRRTRIASGYTAAGEVPPVVMVDEIATYTRKPPFHRGSCHLTVNGKTDAHLDALHALAAKIGMKRSWSQAPKSPIHTAHYDLTPSMRAAALQAGAVFVPGMEQARARIAARDAVTPFPDR